MPLSHPGLEAVRKNEGVIEFATLGSGNHFVELQSDEGGQLWLMVHSGSRGPGPRIRDHHLERAEPVGAGLRALDATSEQGALYLRDADWARRFADAGRKAIAMEVEVVMRTILSARLCRETAITADHNHVSLEVHGGRDLWVHRQGREEALCPSAHGAGRALSRTAARAQVTERELHRQMNGVWYDYRLADRLRDEAPAAYKDIKAVLRAQRDLVKVTRVLRPVLTYKGV
jgi:tRNA-splicing ligase RtcB